MPESLMRDDIDWTVPVASPASSQRKTWKDHFRESPSWLTSFVIHFLCFLTVLSITSPKQNRQGQAAVVLTMSHRDDSTSTSLIREVTIPQSMSEDGETDKVPAKVFQRVEELPRPTTTPQSLTMESDDSADQSEASKSSESSAVKYAALTMRQRRSATGSSIAVSRAASNPATQSEFDKTVDRFILYDVGDLRGAEGSLALRKFRELGPSAIPALVRGLNKSANINASCPVGVIAAKLMHSLRDANDPNLTRYAVDHIGEGVSKYAPHFRRIIAFRDSWISKLHELPTRTAEMLTQRGLDGDGAMLEIALSLTDSSVTELLIAVESDDDDLSVPAMVALLQRARNFSKADQFRARSALAKKNYPESSKQAQKLINECNSHLSRLQQVRDRNRKNRRTAAAVRRDTLQPVPTGMPNRLN